MTPEEYKKHKRDKAKGGVLDRLASNAMPLQVVVASAKTKVASSKVRLLLRKVIFSLKKKPKVSDCKARFPHKVCHSISILNV